MTAPSFRLLSYPEDAEAIAAAFAELDHALGGVGLYQSHAWFRHNVDGTPPPGCRGVRVLLIDQESTLAGVIPLTWIPSRIGRLRLESLVVPWHRGEASAIHLRPGSDFEVLLPGIQRFLAREWPGWDALVWPKQLPLSSARLARGGWLGHLTVSVPTGESMTLPVSAAPAEATARLSANARAALRKARNRLKGHQVEYRVLDAPGVDMSEALEAFLVLEGAGWKQLDRSRWPVFRILMAEMAQQRRFRLYQLVVDGTLAAGALALAGPPDRLGIYKIAYNESLARFSPGKLLLSYILEDGRRRGDIRILDLMSSAPWLVQWKPVAEPLHTLWCFRPTPRGLIGFLAMTTLALIGPAVRPVIAESRTRGQRVTKAVKEPGAS